MFSSNETKPMRNISCIPFFLSIIYSENNKNFLVFWQRNLMAKCQPRLGKIINLPVWYNREFFICAGLLCIYSCSSIVLFWLIIFTFPLRVIVWKWRFDLATWCTSSKTLKGYKFHLIYIGLKTIKVPAQKKWKNNYSVNGCKREKWWTRKWASISVQIL